METVSLSQRIYDSLLKKILSNEYPSGTILNRRAIAAEYHVSVAPVLEAMLQLEKEGDQGHGDSKRTGVRLSVDSGGFGDCGSPHGLFSRKPQRAFEFPAAVGRGVGFPGKLR